MLSGNRNFEGRVNPDVRANYLASPPLVVAYALLGTMTKDITTVPLGQDKDGNDVFLKDVWPTSKEVAEMVRTAITRDMFDTRYADVFKGDEHWQAVEVSGGLTYDWPLSVHLRAQPAVLRGHGHGAGADRGYRGRAHSGALPGLPSRPTTSRRPAPSSRPRRPGRTCPSTRSA